jgi:putative ABC transport system permease protein
MPRIPGIRRLFRFPSPEARVSSDVDEEITFRLEERTQKLIAQGVDPAAARAVALGEFGAVREARAELEQIGRRRVRHLRRANRWSDLRQDLKYGARSLRHAPLFTLLAIVTLALGIGANAAVFGVLKSVLLDALPYADADNLVRVYARWLDGSMERGPMSAGTVADLASRQRSFVRLAAFVDNVSDAIYGDESGSRITRLAWVEPTFFDTIGVTAARGRLLTQEDATSGLAPLSAATVVPDTARAVLVTNGAWQRLFGGDLGVPGRTIRLNGVTRTIVGVLPRDFVGPLGDIDFYAAFDLAPVVARPTMARSAYWLGAIGRLKPGIAHETAQHELASIGTVLAREYARDNSSFAIASMPLRDAMVGDTRTPLLVLMTSAALVLLIACANLTGALLARTLARRKELAVRIALGAGRGRLIRQLLTESLLLALTGGVAGVLLAWLVLSTLQGVGRTALPDYADLTLDFGVVLVTAILSVCAGLAFGLAPALSVDRSDPQGALRAGIRGASESRRSHRLRGLLVAGQIALCVSLLAGAGLLARSLWAMTTAPLGFDPDHVLTATVQMPPRDYPTPAARIRFLEQFADRLRTLPDVQAVADVTMIPTAGVSRTSFVIDGAPPRPNEAQPGALRAMVSDDYFRTLRIPVRQGRTFDTRDRLGAPPTVVISESMARRYWPEGNALGARIRLSADARAPVMEVVGIVGDVRNDRARPDAEPMLYRSSRQSPWPFSAFVLRTGGDPLALLKPMERELAAVDRGLALQRAMSLRTVVGEGLAGRQLPVLLMTSFGALALVLASVGVYAMFASIAAARAWEFGLRMVLGSRPRAIAGLVVREGAGWMAIGLAGGAVGVVLVVRLLRGLLYEVPPFDPIALGAAVAILVCCATIALLIPLRRATHVDPATALRTQ